MSMNSNTKEMSAAAKDTEAKYHEEDGWIFRERPGIPVECLYRANQERADMTPPNQIRHNYPSA